MRANYSHIFILYFLGVFFNFICTSSFVCAQDTSDYYKTAHKAYTDSVYSEAIENAQRAIELDKTPGRRIAVAAYVLLGVIYTEKTGQYDEAIECLEKAVQDVSVNQSIRYSLGLAYYQKGQYDKAKNNFLEAKNLDKNHHQAYFYLGEIYKREANYNEAIEMYKHTIRLQPKASNAIISLAEIYIENNNFTEALAEYYKLSDANQSVPDIKNNIYYCQARLHENKKKWAKAKLMYSLLPENFRDVKERLLPICEAMKVPLTIFTKTLPKGRINKTYKAMLEASGGDGDYQWEVNDLPKGLSLEGNIIVGRPQQSGSDTVTIQVKDGQGKTDTITLFLKIQEPPPHPAYEDYELAHESYSGSDYSKATMYCKSAISSDDTPDRKIALAAYRLLGVIYTEKTNQPDEAIRWLDKAIKEGQIDPPIKYSLGLAYYQREQYNNARREFMEVRRLDSNHFQSCFYLGELYRNEDHYDRAIEMYKYALNLKPDYLNAITSLAEIYIQNNNFTDALAEYNKLSDDEKENTIIKNDVHYCQAKVYEGQQNWEKAKHEYEFLPNGFRDRDERLQALTVTILTDSLPSGQLNQSYSYTLEASGGDGNYHWSAKNLHQGLQSNNNLIIGTPREYGNFSVLVYIKDDRGISDTAKFSLNIKPLPLQIANNSLLPVGKINESYRTTLKAIGGDGNYNWHIIDGHLPLGLELSNNVILGKPQEDKRSYITVQVTDGQRTQAEKILCINIEAATSPPPILPLQIITNSLPSGEVDKHYFAELIATGGKGSYRWYVDNLPNVLSLKNNIIEGTPSNEMSISLTIRVQDEVETEKTITLYLNILPKEDIEKISTSIPKWVDLLIWILSIAIALLFVVYYLKIIKGYKLSWWIIFIMVIVLSYGLVSVINTVLKLLNFK